MIANRFRAVGLVAGISAAALTCYLVSLQVAAERAQLNKVERQILSTRADIRQLAMELDTRSRLVQLERWNTDVLGLKAPAASQYAADAVQLAAYAPARVAPPVVQAVAIRPAAPGLPGMAQTVAYRAPAPLPAPAVLPAPVPIHRAVAVRPAAAAVRPAETVAYRVPSPQPKVQTVAFDQPVLHRASFTADAPAVPAKPAPKRAKPALLSDDLLATVGRAAAAETKSKAGK